MTEADLLAAIDADPLDDAPRLAHVEWLEANGDADRAAFVRERLYARRDRVARWVAHLPQAPGMTWECDRGLPEGVRFDSLAAFKRGWPLAAGHRVRRVAFDSPRNPAKLAAEPALAGIADLELAGSGPDTAEVVLRSPHLAALRRFRYEQRRGDDDSFLRRLLDSPVLDRLECLEWRFFTPSGLPAPAVADFFASLRIAGLRELVVTGQLDPGAMRAVLASPHLGDLRVLEFGTLSWSSWAPGTALGDLDSLGDGATLAGLERLHLHSGIGDRRGAEAVARATRLTRLRVLDFASGRVGDAGMIALADAPHLGGLEQLDVRYCAVGDAGAAALAGSRLLVRLAALDLANNLVGRAGVAALGRTAALPRLRELRLLGNPAPAEFAAAVEARFRDGTGPVEEAAPRGEPAIASCDIPVVGDVDEDGLIRAILADPFDDLSRAAYADWLEEHDSPEYAAAVRAPAAERASRLGPLVAALGRDAPGEFTAALGDEGLLRLAISTRELTKKAFAADGAAWLRRHRVFEVAPQGTSSKWREIFAADWLGAVRGLTFDGQQFAAYDALAQSPHLPALAALTTGVERFGPSGFVSLLRGADLRGLCLLRRTGYFAPEVFVLLTATSVRPGLRNLTISSIRQETLAAFTESPAFAGLTTLKLDLQFNSSARILADARGLAGLRNLDLSHSTFAVADAAAGAEALADSALVRRLRRFRVRASNLAPESLRRLADALAAGATLAVAGTVDEVRRTALDGATCRVEYS